MRCITKVEYLPNNSIMLHTSRSQMTISADHKMMQKAIGEYQAGAMIQSAFYFLTSTIREYMISGLTPQEQELIFQGN